MCGVALINISDMCYYDNCVNNKLETLNLMALLYHKNRVESLKLYMSFCGMLHHNVTTYITKLHTLSKVIDVM